ncbi:MAG TPA: alpha-ketoglutarate-dependent dioxygenase AlkB [Polyangiaceae bacterium]|nr:alpha-ketoglutarate-dependent dioxygenase AlkB [Polyangiaceae bacterium]
MTAPVPKKPVSSKLGPKPQLREFHDPRGHHYFPGYLQKQAREQLLAWLGKLHPIWEQRYSTLRDPPTGQTQRSLLRPVYWLGNWQFACLDYYRPPRGTHDRCVAAEPFPEVLSRIVADTERRISKLFPRKDIPEGYRLNTCLVNFYGARREGDKWIDTARVGEHRDFEPGPVASLSLGERALFQFVRSQRIGEREAPLVSQWLDDGSLQIFGGSFFKDKVFHRVQRVDKREKIALPPEIDGFRTRRINFTFRYVPTQHVIPFAKLGKQAREDVRGYVTTLAEHSSFFQRALNSDAG